MNQEPRQLQQELSNIRVIIVDAHPILREGLRMMINNHPLCDVVAEAGDLMGAMFACANHVHDVILINYGMAPREAVEIITEFRQSFPDARLVVGQLPEDVAQTRQLWSMGVTGFLSGRAEAREYTASVISVWGGGIYFSADLVQQLLLTPHQKPALENARGLTEREIEVLELLTSGYCNKEIATMCDLSVRTVETHRLNIRRKTSSNTLSDLVRVAKEIGLSTMADTNSENSLRR